jgi:hypothetical protein
MGKRKSLVIRQEHRWGVFQNRGAEENAGLRRKEETGSRRKLHSVELHNVYS